MSNAVTALAIEAKADHTQLESLWNAVERLIISWACRYHQGNASRLFDTDDLTQAGYLAMVDALRGYDASKGEFTTYLHFHIRRCFNEVAGIRGKRRPEMGAISLDRPLDADSDMSLVDTIQDPAAEFEDDVIERVYTVELRAVLDECIERLTPDCSAVLRARYFEDKPTSAIASERGITADMVRRKEVQALQGLRYGKNYTRLKAWREDIISRSYRRSGLSLFRHSGYSSTEWAAFKLIEQEEKSHGERTKFEASKPERSPRTWQKRR